MMEKRYLLSITSMLSVHPTKISSYCPIRAWRRSRNIYQLVNCWTSSTRSGTIRSGLIERNHPQIRPIVSSMQKKGYRNCWVTGIPLFGRTNQNSTYSSLMDQYWMWTSQDKEFNRQCIVSTVKHGTGFVIIWRCFTKQRNREIRYFGSYDRSLSSIFILMCCYRRLLIITRVPHDFLPTNNYSFWYKSSKQN
jgi:hypothetical protein